MCDVVVEMKGSRRICRGRRGEWNRIWERRGDWSGWEWMRGE
jgi:hypothetical protein